MRGNIQGLLAQAQKMQKNVERLQAELDCIKKQENPVRMALLSAIWRRDFLSFAFSDLFL